MNQSQHFYYWFPSRHSLIASAKALLLIMALTLPIALQHNKQQQNASLKAITHQYTNELSTLFSHVINILKDAETHLDERCGSDQLLYLRQQVFDTPLLGAINVVTPKGELICSSWQKHTPSLSSMSPRRDQRLSLAGPIASLYLESSALLVRYTTTNDYEINAELPVNSLKKQLNNSLHSMPNKTLLTALVDAKSGVPLWSNAPYTLPLQGAEPTTNDDELNYNLDTVDTAAPFPLTQLYHYEGPFDDGSYRSLYAAPITSMPDLALIVASSSTAAYGQFGLYVAPLFASYMSFFIVLALILNYSEHHSQSPKRRILQGLAKGEFYNVYQPLVDAVSGEIVAVEVLIRWADPDQGLIMPSVFLPDVERSDLEVALTLYQLNAIRDELLPVTQAHPNLCIAVNVSRKQLLDDACIQAMLTLAQEIPMLKVELTEHDVIDVNDAMILANLSRLSAAGIKIAVDDFGTGYCGMAYLNHFPINQLKIDRSFVSIIGTDSPNTLVLGAVIALGQKLGLELVAEGVELPFQAEHLSALGVDIHQGWLYAKPMKATVFKQHLKMMGANVYGTHQFIVA
jgi:sensor c-di-GMP phosphodiesterase-like protein